MTKFYDEETSEHIFQESKGICTEILAILATKPRVISLAAIEMIFLIVAEEAKLHPNDMQEACDAIAKNYELNIYPEALKRTKP